MGLSAELARTIETFADAEATATDIDQAWRHVVELPARSIAGCDGASVCIRARTMVCLASSDERSHELDLLQHRTDRGPCPAAAVTSSVQHTGDIYAERRWPVFTKPAAASGIRSIVAMPLVHDGRTLGTFSLYGTERRAFDAVAHQAAQLLAGHVARALVARARLSAADRHLVDVREARPMGASPGCRGELERAQALLMTRYRISSALAYDLLKQSSQQLNVKLREVTHHVVTTGEIPTSDSRSATPTT